MIVSLTQCDDKAPMRKLHSIPVTVFGSGHNGKKKKQLDAVVHMQESTQKVPKPASQAVFVDSRMHLTLHVTRRTPHGAARLA